MVSTYFILALILLDGITFVSGFLTSESILESKNLFPSFKRPHSKFVLMPHISARESHILMAEKLRIAIVGSGAVGCYYGARLWECGYDVMFHMRGEHLKNSLAKGLNITSVAGDVFIPPEELKAYGHTSEMGQVGWVILALKSTGISATASLLDGLLSEKTRVFAIMNGMVDDDITRLIEGVEMGRELPPKLSKCNAIYGGMALLCSNRIAPGHIDHSHAGKLTGSLARSRDERDDGAHRDAMIELWEPINAFEFCWDDNLVRARWTKNVWNLPFNGISVAMNGITVDKIVNDPGLRRLAYTIMDETIAIANEDLKFHGSDTNFFLGEAEKNQMMSLSDNMGPYKTSTMLSLRNHEPMEVKYIFRKAVDRANELNVPAPTLETIVTQIEFLQRLHGL